MKKRDIPVILYRERTAAWDAFDPNSNASVIAAMYKNQLADIERKMLHETDGTGEIHALRNELRRAKMAEQSPRKKRAMPSGLAFAVLVAAVFYCLWLYMQN